MGRRLIPFRPEGINALRGRFFGALDRIHDAESMRLGVACYPCECPENVFDFEGGLRIVLSLEDVADAGLIRHLTGTCFEEDSELYRRLKSKRDRGNLCGAINGLKVLCLLNYRKIARDEAKLEFGYIDHYKEPHWFRSESNK